ncbi:MAG TPA: hypothetical protein DD440_03795 [Porticoccaceae bacterium]|nr:hypothetical protein [Porticoccaceae bacterium]
METQRVVSYKAHFPSVYIYVASGDAYCTHVLYRCPLKIRFARVSLNALLRRVSLVTFYFSRVACIEAIIALMHPFENDRSIAQKFLRHTAFGF